MTVRELIAALSNFNPDARVVTAGFDESNVEDIETVETVTLRFHDERERSHTGRHEECDDGEIAIFIDF